MTGSFEDDWPYGIFLEHHQSALDIRLVHHSIDVKIENPTLLCSVTRWPVLVIHLGRGLGFIKWFQCSMYSSNDFQTAYFVSTLLELLTRAEGSDQIKTDKKHNDLVLQCRNKIVSLSHSLNFGIIALFHPSFTVQLKFYWWSYSRAEAVCSIHIIMYINTPNRQYYGCIDFVKMNIIYILNILVLTESVKI